MQVKLTGSVLVARKMMNESRRDGDNTLIACSLGLQAIRVSAYNAETIAGFPRDSFKGLFEENGDPKAQFRMALPNRALMATGKIELQKDSGTIMHAIEVREGVATKIQLRAWRPESRAPAITCAFVLVWKAAGDETNDINGLLGEKCYFELVLKEEPKTIEMPLIGGRPSKQAEKEADKIDNKRRASGEKDDDDREEQNVIARLDKVVVPTPPPAPAPPATAKRGNRDLSIDKLTEEAKAHAAKHPRREPAKPAPTGGRGGSRRH